MIIRKKAYPRAGLVGNPSDGYFGKTIAFVFTNFSAEVVLYESPDLEIVPNTRDHSVFRNIDALAEDVRLYGYYGGIRLLKATVRRFRDYCQEGGIPLHDRNFTLRYASDIPRLVGLGGSSAIITACLQALMAYYQVDISLPVQANLVLSVETDELDIAAGLQDRVAQVYEGLVYMDFAQALMEARGYGDYVPLDPARLPPLYIAYRADLCQGSEIFHSTLRERFNRGVPEVVEAITYWSNLTDQVRACLETDHADTFNDLLNANFDRRAQVCPISEGNQRMIDAARAQGVSAKFTGSGGAIVGACPDDACFQRLKAALEALDVHVFRPVVPSRRRNA